MKKLLVFLLSAVLMLGAFVGCKADVDNHIGDDDSSEASSTESTPTSSNGLTSSELEEFWGNADLDVEGGTSSEDNTSEDETTGDETTPGGNETTPGGDENESKDENTSSEEDGGEETPGGSGNDEDEFNNYVPGEKDEGFGPWI